MDGLIRDWITSVFFVAFVLEALFHVILGEIMAKDKAKKGNPPADGEKMEKSEIAKKEEEILRFWQENKIFEKTEEKLSTEEFVFYDGPPFATGLPHYGHILAGTIKDAIPRYQTMKGKRVKRRWGWDCHGLPLENIIEEELGLKTKKDILDYGIDKFNAAAKKAVLRYTDDWKWIVPRLGRFVDMDNDYKTMDASYTESVWWIFKTLYDKGLIYEGYKSMHICPRCETTLSNFEVNQGYKDVKDLAVTVKFELIDKPNNYLLAWTTTPWTLPGNVALAINPVIDYVAVTGDEPGNVYIVAKERVEAVFGQKAKIVDEFKGQELVGKKYRPVFDYYAADESLKNRENGWQVYPADFVTTEEGTGIVHIAPAFGEDDLKLGQDKELPFVQHVGMDGRFKPEVKDWAGELVKPKDEPDKIDVEIIKYLAGKNLLFAKEKVTHSYPHCWRCETPLLNYAASSWFVKVSAFRDKLVAANQNIGWTPTHIKEGRFGRWLEGARDWAISRSRFWGAPLPVWQCDTCNQVKVIGSLPELAEQLPKAQNRYLALRHGEAESNVANRVSSQVDNQDNLTDIGRQKSAEVGQELKREGVDLIISSDFLRTKATAEIVADELSINREQIIFDPRLREIDAGELEGETWEHYQDFFRHHKHELEKKIPNGESLLDVRARVMNLLFELERDYAGKTILLVSHGLPVFSLLAGAKGVPDDKLADLKEGAGDIKRSQIYEVEFNLLPRDERYSIDLHRPHIDELKLKCACGGEMVRVPEVFDCWFESGAMPYGQVGYRGEPLPEFNPISGEGYPAEFIAEGLDQTRGWFYSLLVLGVALFDRSPYKNVIANGLVLAEDGQKMSKRLRNYPDPLEVVNCYGADALRFYLLSSPVVRAEDLNFSETGVAEVSRQVIARLLNVVQFYNTYTSEADLGEARPVATSHILDEWILARLYQIIEQTGRAFDNYELDRAARPLAEFIDDLSNWYLRRSRDRFHSDDQRDRESAIATTRLVLRETAKLVAPFLPFTAERVWQTLLIPGDAESVHLADWPTLGEVREEVINYMSQTRRLVELLLAERSESGIKVRQPLGRAIIKSELPAEYLALVKDEVNLKAIEVDPSQFNEVALDTEISPALRAEGQARELVRQLQEARKQQGLKPGDLAVATISAPAELAVAVKGFKLEAEIKRAACLKSLEWQVGQEVTVMVKL